MSVILYKKRRGIIDGRPEEVEEEGESTEDELEKNEGGEKPEEIRSWTDEKET